jgi:L,D-peptidoglycan transpeptidase YkuD (ErfK/YbiS/YcfS/YnhG family)
MAEDRAIACPPAMRLVGPLDAGSCACQLSCMTRCSHDPLQRVGGVSGPSRRAALIAFVGAGMAMSGCSSPVPVPRIAVSNGRLICGDLSARCAVGRAGVRRDKVEGDGATPAGVFPLRALLFRPDRLQRVQTGLPVHAIAPDDGWCDDPAHPAYNRAVKLPFPASHEELWRRDHLYDLVIVVGHNDAPPISGKGSAVFLHVAAPDYAATAGCVALALPDLLAVAGHCGPETVIEIG